MVEWRQVDWLPDYEISEDGDVRRLTGTRRNDPRYGPGYVIKGYPAGFRRQYRYVKLTLADGNQIKLPVHRLVCEAWHGKPPPEHEVAHNDGNPANNHWSNLRWDTPLGNYADHERLGTLWRDSVNGRFRRPALQQ